MDSPCSIFAVLYLCQSLSTTFADSKYGCLFEDELCTPYEFCANDGVFGRCLELPGADLYTYDASASALQRLKTLLQKLAHKGLTWQDATTQHVISRELSKLRKVPIRRPDPPSASLTRYGGDRKLKTGEAKLSRSVQKYLQELGLLPQSAGTTRQELQREGPLNQNEDLQPKKGKSTFYNLQSAGPPQGGKVFTQGAVGSWRSPVETAYSSQEPGRARGSAMGLAAQLERYMAGAAHTQSRPVPGAVVGPKGKLYYVSYVRPGGQVVPQTQLGGSGSKPPRPNIDRLLFKAASNHQVPKEQLSTMDERFILNVVNKLGRQRVNMDSLMGKDLDQLADIISGALQVVDEEGPEARAKPRLVGHIRDRQMKREPLHSMDQDEEDQEDMLAQDAMLQGKQMVDADSEPNDKDPILVSKLLEYLNKDPFSDAPDAQLEVGDAGGAAGNPSIEGQRTVGLENVRSRTTQGQVPVPHPWEERSMTIGGEDGAPDQPDDGTSDQPVDVQGSDSLVDSEVERWMYGTEAPSPPAAEMDLLAEEPQEKNLLAEPQKKDMRLQEEVVHMGVKAYSKSPQGKDHHSDTGYIITDTDSLTSDQGLDLMERLGRRVNLHLSDLHHLSVLGPAVTFRVGTNPHNVSTADVAHVAVQQKKQLEKETGVKILEAGVSDKGSLRQIPVVTESRLESGQFLVLTVISMVLIMGALAASGWLFCLRHRSHLQLKKKLASLGTDTSADATSTYQSYMEDHLKNKNRLEREWEAMCGYLAEPGACNVGQDKHNTKRNRTDAVVVYDHSRITLKAENNHGNSDYINASPIMDHDPRNPMYISSQGPLPSTVADFWQMVWENGCVVIVMLTPLSENGVKQCQQYWPDEGFNVYHVYEVNLVSEHIWCEDFLVRSFYLKNLQSNETRTVTQFHFLSWVDRSIPDSARIMLDFRRKVNKCYRGRSCPIIVHCSDGAGRSGTYILIDMVLNRMAKGAKEIDIAATLEHLRDQRPGMVQTKEQFEFALTAVAEEVNAILKALPQ
ncbi:receptor-type tyrosine-protein phosphatase N2 isoform X3 [Salmo salar]|uniref:Receptor-type tyrosine-protein phosphatase N2 isoform X3 n=1 Tax=Salmo salar TaxID=8030 RepID=A0A1S3Q837_SALSA|nr:receptor-type tyrosine-protein phosphatase N2 isoform X3 [Salmo salar]|eukprot:XP_014036135.1 PREDICTED: receptor-type tyrosine-protein phosphatase N2 isoform X3 [Salmo salar]